MQAMNHLEEMKSEFAASLKRMGMGNVAFSYYLDLYEKFLTANAGKGDSGKIPWAEIESLHDRDSVAYEAIATEKNFQIGCGELHRLAVIRLNGGLATTMNMKRPKSLVRVREERSFLDLSVKQIQALRRQFRLDVPWMLMHSFRTRDECLAALDRYPDIQRTDWPLDFMQHCLPRIDACTRLPSAFDTPADNWAPPGHGDMLIALAESGVLDRLLAKDIVWAFVSNIDNLGATVDLAILGHLTKSQHEFAMEITPKLPVDAKGGILIRRHNHLALLERSQVEPPLHRFEDISRFPFFSTNNIWLRLDKLHQKVSEHKSLPLILNPKTVQGKNIVQLETAIGAAIEWFERSVGVIVPRSRFFPVKNTADLLSVRSDYLVESVDGYLSPNPSRSTEQGPPFVSLDTRYYADLNDFERRIPYPLSLIGCKTLMVEGDVRFGKHVCCQGDVRISNAKPEPLYIEDDARLMGTIS